MKELLRSKKVVWILIVGVLIRLFLSFSTFHADIRTFDFVSYLIAKGNVFNLYDYLRNLPPNSNLLKIYPLNLFIYPPAIYLFFGTITRLFTLPINMGMQFQFILDVKNVLGSIQFNFLLLLFKMPYIFFDLAIAFLITTFFENMKWKKMAFLLWIFNPISIYATYMMGQFDIIPTFFVLLVLYLVKKKEKVGFSNFYLESFLLGVGAAFKVYPLFFLIPLAFLKKDLFKQIKIVIVGFFSYLIFIFPFLFSPGFRSSALVAGHTLKSLYAQIAVSGGESILLFPSFLLFIYFVFYYSKNTVGELWKKFFLILLLFFVFTHTHPQWFLWLTPYLIIDLVKSKMKHWPLVSITLFVYIVLLFFFDKGLTISLFSPIYPALYDVSSVWKLLGISPDINLMRSVFHSLFVGSAFYYLYFYFRHND